MGNNRITKECIHHGLTTHNRYKSGTYKTKQLYRYRCGKCGTKAVEKRRRLLKIKAVEYKGGSCSKCSYNKCIRVSP